MKGKNNRIAMIAVIAGIAIIAAIFILPFMATAGNDEGGGSRTSSLHSTDINSDEIASSSENTTGDRAVKTETAGNTSAASDTKQAPGAKKPKVTFIELGSVKCIPCKMMQPVMQKIRETYPDSVEVVFYDVWTEKDKAKAFEYNINAIPTQVFIDCNGKEYFRHVGFFPFDEVEKVLKQKL